MLIMQTGVNINFPLYDVTMLPPINSATNQHLSILHPKADQLEKTTEELHKRSHAVLLHLLKGKTGISLIPSASVFETITPDGL